jgi:hypothetical protein
VSRRRGLLPDCGGSFRSVAHPREGRAGPAENRAYEGRRGGTGPAPARRENDQAGIARGVEDGIALVLRRVVPDVEAGRPTRVLESSPPERPGRRRLAARRQERAGGVGPCAATMTAAARNAPKRGSLVPGRRLSAARPSRSAARPSPGNAISCPGDARNLRPLRRERLVPGGPPVSGPAHSPDESPRNSRSPSSIASIAATSRRP